MKQTIIFFLIVAVIVAVLFLTSGNKATPLIPPDEKHLSAHDDKSCLPCHPLEDLYKGKHPKKEQCLICHKRANSPRH